MAYLLQPTDVAKTLYDLNRTYDGQRTWRDLYTDLQSNAELLRKTASLEEQRSLSNLKYDYDTAVSEAYKSSLEQQNLISGSMLGSGYKSALEQQSMNALNKAFEEYRKNYIENKSKIESAFDETYLNIDTSYNQTMSDIATAQSTESEKYSRYNEAFYDYLSYLYKERPDMFESDPNFNKYTVQDDDGTIRLKGRRELYDSDLLDGGTLNTAGREFYSQMFYNDQVLKFQDYLEHTDKYTDLVDWAIANDYANQSTFFKDVLGLDTTLPQNYKSIVADTNQGAIDVLKTDIQEGNVSDITTRFPNTYNDVDWSISGLGTGRNNDDIVVTISNEQFDLRTMEFADKNGDIVKALNLIATGNENKTPATSAKYADDENVIREEGAFGDKSVGGRESITSNKYKPGKLVVYQGNMYLYTVKGWKQLISEDDDEDDITRAIAKYSENGKFNIPKNKVTNDVKKPSNDNGHGGGGGSFR